jgi:hypothetical protein
MRDAFMLGWKTGKKDSLTSTVEGMKVLAKCREIDAAADSIKSSVVHAVNRYIKFMVWHHESCYRFFSKLQSGLTSWMKIFRLAWKLDRRMAKDGLSRKEDVTTYLTRNMWRILRP